MTPMDITIHTTFLPHDDPDAALAFYRDALGFLVIIAVLTLRPQGFFALKGRVG